MFKWIVLLSHAETARNHLFSSDPLLERMRELMGKQALAGRGVRSELAMREHDVAANRVGQSTKVPRRRCCLGI
jgi:hypothetical protein